MEDTGSRSQHLTDPVGSPEFICRDNRVAVTSDLKSQCMYRYRYGVIFDEILHSLKSYHCDTFLNSVSTGYIFSNAVYVSSLT